MILCHIFYTIYVFFFTLSNVICQSCPNGWEDFSNSCYKFTRSPHKSVIQAEDTCLLYNAHLISVNTLEEHLFVTNWLRNNDPIHRKWYTSGRDSGTNSWRWDSDRSEFTMISDLWLPIDENTLRKDWTLSSGKHAAYNFSQTANRWGLIRVDPNDEMPYICEIKKEDLINSFVVERNIDYGITVIDKTKVPRGPTFTHEPKPAVFDLSGRSQLNYVSMRCVADGYPTPIYKWYKEEYVNNILTPRYIDPLSDNRITQTDGTLTIFNPQQSQDRGKYHCTAQNKFGIIISQTVQLSFGYIGEFTKKRSPDYGKEYWGKSISCDPPQHHPRVNYYWTRNSFPNFVEEDRRVFVSHDGNLYFSSLEKIDRANYSCNVQSVISSTGRTGPFFPLIVDPASSGQKLLFPNNFPKAFPEAPLAGDDVRLECMAYGYPVPSYNWSRSGVTDRLPEGSYTTNHNRVLMLPKVQVEDMGDYICTVTSGREAIQKKVMLSIQSLPVFTIKLGNKVIERGATKPLVWTCEAFGIPEVYYQWYKNGVELSDRSRLDNSLSLSPEDRHRYIVKENILTIDGLIPERDEGLYQCKAYNQLGSAFTSGQLRIVSMAPSFRKHPLELETYASEGGNVTIPCVPEAVPFPSFEWQREGSKIGGIVGRVKILPNGFLSINPVQVSDEGLYTCIARNELGFDRTQGYLRVFNRPRIYEGPGPSYERRVNETMELPCAAYTDSVLDVAYIWMHNGLRINFTKMPQFSAGLDPGFLRLNNITLSEAGEYVCIVKTSVGKNFARTRLQVYGPPSAPGAVLAEELTATSAKIHWSDGSDNGRRIWAYMIEGRTNHNSTWVPIANVTDYHNQYVTIRDSGRKITQLKEVLSPWSSYEFRVSAINDLGLGPPSDPSPQYNTDKAVPFKAPANVGGGGGKAGTLTITWDPLPPQDWNAPEVWYRIYYKPEEADREPYISKNLTSLGNTNMYAVNVGEDNYFKRYLVRVQAMNMMGAGRAISDPVVVYSAETMPQVAPNQVYAVAYNSTSLNVSWAPLEMTREKIRGRLIGHRIKYWPNNKDPQLDSLTLLNRGLNPWGLIVALVPDTEYYIAVMAYNDAGSGPESEPFLARTYKAAPQRQPTSVNITAIDSHSVMVTWRGITTLTNAEEPITGYKVRYWESDQPISSAREVYKYLDGGDLKAIISDLIPGKVYKLRVLAFSSGGDGKMSSQWEFRVGEGVPSHLTSSAKSNFIINFSLILTLIFIIKPFQ